jgi:hypothetical protein
VGAKFDTAQDTLEAHLMMTARQLMKLG